VIGRFDWRVLGRLDGSVFGRLDWRVFCGLDWIGFDMVDGRLPGRLDRRVFGGLDWIVFDSVTGGGDGLGVWTAVVELLMLGACICPVVEATGVGSIDTWDCLGVVGREGLDSGGGSED